MLIGDRIKMVIVKNLFADAVETDVKNIAYMCYWLILNGHGEKEFDSCIDLIDVSEVARMTSEDVLKLERPNVYLVKRKASWCCYMAYNESEVRGLHLNLFNEIPSLIIDNTNSINTTFWFEDLQQYKSLFDIRNELTIFPQFIFEI